MFCEKCGTQLPDDAMFCPECGEKVKVLASPQPQIQPQEQKVKKTIPKKTIGLVAAAVAIVAVVIGVVVFIATRPKKISLNQYVTAKFEGFDGYGTVKIDFDEDQFVEDNLKKVKFKGKDKKVYQAFYDSAADALVDLVQGYELSQRDKLSNGGTVTYKWEIADEKILESFGVKMKYSDIDFKVEGLKKIQEFDPFEAIDVIFQGIDSYGNARIDYKDVSEEFPSLYYELDKTDALSLGDEVTVTASTYGSNDVAQYCAEYYGMKPKALTKKYKVEGLQEIEEFDPFDAISVQFEGTAPYVYASIVYNEVGEDFPSLYYELNQASLLSNGDEVTVNVSCYSDDIVSYCAENYGKKPTTVQKTYKVENLPQYITSMDMFPQSELDSVIEDYKTEFAENADSSWDEYSKLNSIEYVGYYLLAGREENYSRNNQLALVFQVNMMIDIPDYNYQEDLTYYFTVAYDNIIMNENGKVEINRDNFANTTDYFEHEIVYGEEYWQTTNFYYYGYETLDAAKEAIGYNFGYDYDYDTNLE